MYTPSSPRQIPGMCKIVYFWLWILCWVNCVILDPFLLSHQQDLSSSPCQWHSFYWFDSRNPWTITALFLTLGGFFWPFFWPSHLGRCATPTLRACPDRMFGLQRDQYQTSRSQSLQHVWPEYLPCGSSDTLTSLDSAPDSTMEGVASLDASCLVRLWWRDFFFSRCLEAKSRRKVPLWGRGSRGQHFYHLLVLDKNYDRKKLGWKMKNNTWIEDYFQTPQKNK